MSKGVGNMHFIYVMSEQDKNKMLALGYVLMKEDIRNRVWVFQNKNDKEFARDNEIYKSGIHFIPSNTLTF